MDGGDSDGERDRLVLPGFDFFSDRARWSLVSGSGLAPDADGRILRRIHHLFRVQFSSLAAASIRRPGVRRDLCHGFCFIVRARGRCGHVGRTVDTGRRVGMRKPENPAKH